MSKAQQKHRIQIIQCNIYFYLFYDNIISKDDPNSYLNREAKFSKKQHSAHGLEEVEEFSFKETPFLAIKGYSSTDISELHKNKTTKFRQELGIFFRENFS